MTRICDLCKTDSPHLTLFGDYRGNGIGLICDDCWPKATAMLGTIPGAPMRDDDGNPICSPFHTAHIRNFDHLRQLSRLETK